MYSICLARGCHEAGAQPPMTHLRATEHYSFCPDHPDHPGVKQVPEGTMWLQVAQGALSRAHVPISLHEGACAPHGCVRGGRDRGRETQPGKGQGSVCVGAKALHSNKDPAQPEISTFKKKKQKQKR